MQSHFQITIQQHQPRERRVFNALLALVTGLLTLSYPNFLYLIAGGYLIALGVLFLWFRSTVIIAALPIIMGAIIFAFPELIPITFAAFLGFFGLILLLAFQFAVMGFLTLIIAVLIVMNPESVAYLIAAFLLLYGFSNLIRLFQEKRNRHDNDPDVIVH
jgi:membrane-associated HD superfamily phosphohydrolase